ncbi:hypothetical protein BT69DRAFT_1283675 [Atractiella rhizophila]|nr:hypothetical protein BT69DRAFT_1283675 [Atractiella rhizophila]
MEVSTRSPGFMTLRKYPQFSQTGRKAWQAEFTYVSSSQFRFTSLSVFLNPILA